MDHTPVLLNEVLTALAPADGGVYVDATFGAGGYTRAILNAADCTVYAIDRDPVAIAHAEKIAKEYPGRLVPAQGCFGSVRDILGALGVTHIDGIVLDLGVSSMQLDQADRGFSFQKDGPLDMRMGDDGQTVADVVNTVSETDLANILFEYGQEKQSRRIAKAIVTARKIESITTTLALANIIHTAKGRKKESSGTDSATRSFQALRIYVNDELNELDKALIAAEHLLGPDGRIVVVTFHSLEDTRVKRFFKHRSGNIAGPSRHMPAILQRNKMPVPSFLILNRKAIAATDAELRVNPRARSARLRAAMRTQAPVWGVTEGAA